MWRLDQPNDNNGAQCALAKLVGLRQLLQVGITADTELRTPRVNQLLVAPSLVGQLLLGAELTGVALTMARRSRTTARPISASNPAVDTRSS